MSFYISKRFIISILILTLSVLTAHLALSQQNWGDATEVQVQEVETEDKSDDGSKKDDASKKGTVTYVEGNARKKPVKGESWIEAIVNSSVIEGEKLKTLRRSRAELELTEGNIIRLAERTTIDIVKLFEENRFEFSGADLESILIRAKFLATMNNHIIITEDDLRQTIRDFIPPSYPHEIELQNLVAVLECTSREMVPKRFRDYDRHKLVEEIMELKILLGEKDSL